MSIQKLRCLIVDDEQGAHLALQNHVSKMDRLELAGHCYSAVEAANFLQKEAVDVLFLDIEMPEMTGLDLLATLARPPKTILTTAYSEHALAAFEYGAVDYLVKPIPFSRFLKAMDRLLATAFEPSAKAEKAANARASSAFFPIDGEQVKVDFEAIRFVQSWGNYVRIHVGEKALLASLTTSEIEQILPPEIFVRVHKSFIVNLLRIEKVNGARLVVEKNELPIGATYRQKTLERLRQIG